MVHRAAVILLHMGCGEQTVIQDRENVVSRCMCCGRAGGPQMATIHFFNFDRLEWLTKECQDGLPSWTFSHAVLHSGWLCAPYPAGCCPAPLTVEHSMLYARTCCLLPEQHCINRLP